MGPLPHLCLTTSALIWWDIHGDTGMLPCPHWWMPEVVSKSSVDDVRKSLHLHLVMLEFKFIENHALTVYRACAKPIRSGKKEQEQNSPNLWPAFKPSSVVNNADMKISKSLLLFNHE